MRKIVTCFLAAFMAALGVGLAVPKTPEPGGISVNTATFFAYGPGVYGMVGTYSNVLNQDDPSTFSCEFWDSNSTAAHSTQIGGKVVGAGNTFVTKNMYLWNANSPDNTNVKGVAECAWSSIPTGSGSSIPTSGTWGFRNDHFYGAADGADNTHVGFYKQVAAITGDADTASVVICAIPNCNYERWFIFASGYSDQTTARLKIWNQAGTTLVYNNSVTVDANGYWQLESNFNYDVFTTEWWKVQVTDNQTIPKVSNYLRVFTQGYGYKP